MADPRRPAGPAHVPVHDEHRPADPAQAPARDPVTRNAARWAAAVALPVAVVAGLLSYRTLTGAAHPAGSPSPAPQATGPVTMTAPALADRAATVCRALLSQLPGALRDRPRRPV